MRLPTHPTNARCNDNKRKMDERCWYYQEHNGLSVVVESSPVTQLYHIPLTQIRAYLARVDAEEKKR